MARDASIHTLERLYFYFSHSHPSVLLCESAPDDGLDVTIVVRTVVITVTPGSTVI